MMSAVTRVDSGIEGESFLKKAKALGLAIEVDPDIEFEIATSENESIVEGDIQRCLKFRFVVLISRVPSIGGVELSNPEIFLVGRPNESEHHHIENGVGGLFVHYAACLSGPVLGPRTQDSAKNAFF